MIYGPVFRVIHNRLFLLSSSCVIIIMHIGLGIVIVVYTQAFHTKFVTLWDFGVKFVTVSREEGSF